VAGLGDVLHGVGAEGHEVGVVWLLGSPRVERGSAGLGQPVCGRLGKLESFGQALPSPFSSRRVASMTLRRAGRSSSTISQINAGSTRR